MIVPIDIFDVVSDWVIDHFKLLVNSILIAVFLSSMAGLLYIAWRQNIPDKSSTLIINSPKGEKLAQIMVIHPASVFPQKDFILTIRYLPEEKTDFTNVVEMDIIEDNPNVIKMVELFSKDVLLNYSAKDDYKSNVTVFNPPGNVTNASLTLKFKSSSSTSRLPIEIPINHFSPELGFISMIVSILGAIVTNFGAKILQIILSRFG